MPTIYETAYYGPTDNHGPRIRVTNTKTGKKNWHRWDYSVNGGHDQHKHAIRECTVAHWESIQYGGDTKRGYLFAAKTEGEE